MHTILLAHSLQILFSSIAKSPKMELNITELCVAHRYKSVVRWHLERSSLMSKIIIPKGYHSELNLHDTQIAIKKIKDCFQAQLSEQLNLSGVSAPLFVTPESGLNDNLNGVERPVAFTIKEQNERSAEVVHSLAKWKRYALG